MKKQAIEGFLCVWAARVMCTEVRVNIVVVLYRSGLKFRGSIAPILYIRNGSDQVGLARQVHQLRLAQRYRMVLYQLRSLAY
ncbi:hypothetical protein G9U52_08505 [Paenibacillus sp. S3N08]|uniref:Secreted protein n=1 Tax=Paenibacillus agricola TaxID=2716264 RepID=A0ABX0J741_9BACL|nr:hypothetical protein [Paenibacillus agricola]NHN29874.1 hypothetical protein [Paenibacillus agricola]